MIRVFLYSHPGKDDDVVTLGIVRTSADGKKRTTRLFLSADEARTLAHKLMSHAAGGGGGIETILELE